MFVTANAMPPDPLNDPRLSIDDVDARKGLNTEVYEGIAQTSAALPATAVKETTTRPAKAALVLPKWLLSDAIPEKMMAPNDPPETPASASAISGPRPSMNVWLNSSTRPKRAETDAASNAEPAPPIPMPWLK